MRIPQTNFKFNVSAGEYQEMYQSLATSSRLPQGFNGRCGYLTSNKEKRVPYTYSISDQALHDFLRGPIVSQLKGHPAFRDISVKLRGTFDGLERQPYRLAGALIRALPFSSVPLPRYPAATESQGQAGTYVFHVRCVQQSPVSPLETAPRILPPLLYADHRS
jgi:hypothetical protein